MRDIIFRGRKKGGTEWFEGDLSYLVHDKRECYIFPPDGYNSPEWYEVDPATVGQYTGLKDKNGTKIFEGDIMRFSLYGDDYVEVVTFINGSFDITCKTPTNSITMPLGLAIERYGAKKIGNRWDNPELLGEAHDLK